MAVAGWSNCLMTNSSELSGEAKKWYRLRKLFPAMVAWTGQQQAQVEQQKQFQRHLNWAYSKLGEENPPPTPEDEMQINNLGDVHYHGVGVGVDADNRENTRVASDDNKRGISGLAAAGLVAASMAVGGIGGPLIWNLMQNAQEPDPSQFQIRLVEPKEIVNNADTTSQADP